MITQGIVSGNIALPGCGGYLSGDPEGLYASLPCGGSFSALGLRPAVLGALRALPDRLPLSGNLGIALAYHMLSSFSHYVRSPA